MDDELVKETLLDHARSPYHHGSSRLATHTGRFENPACGDSSQIELTIGDEDRIEEAWFQSEGCMVTRAGGSILTQFLEGKTTKEARQLSEIDVLSLLDSPITPHRQICFLLTYFALQDAIGC
ncbi:MAG: iron-sulfur cluster assembly scaffold protein [Pirellulaceae bacterium]|nr:iron-sulfur cluster assembly scaffold protein [Pirellulaceae bacterium]